MTATFTPAQYQQLLDLLSKQENNKASNIYANSSHLTGMFCLVALKNNEWIVNSGASDHMCHDLSKFLSYETLKNKRHSITIPDRRTIPVKYIGSYVE